MKRFTFVFECSSVKLNFFSASNRLALGYKLFYLFILFMMICLNKRELINSATISKCFHEGDFTVYCNKSRLPSSPSGAPEQLELMHYAKVIHGLQHNETLCSYVPGASCSRHLTLKECIDQPYCHVKNNWFSLEPDCRGNAYYTQFEYDCQPAFYMCDKENLARNVFSALIYSPSYPNTFRTDRSEQCFLTLYLPNNHHAEITLEFFDLLPTPNCIGDYLEIRQYIPINHGKHKLVKRDDLLYASNFTGGNSFRSGKNVSSRNNHLNGTLLVKHKKHKIYKNLHTHYNNEPARSSSYQQQHRRDQDLKWDTLGTMCGQVDYRYTIKAKSNIINFKFRPLPSNNPLFTSSSGKQANQHRLNIDNLGFKIFVQAIPPKDPNSSGEPNDKNGDGAGKPIGDPFRSTHSSHGVTPLPGDGDQSSSNKSDSIDSHAKPHTMSISMWIFILIGLILVLVFVLAIVLAIYFIKRKNFKTKSNSSQNSKSSNLANQPAGPGPASATVNKPNNDSVKKSLSNSVKSSEPPLTPAIKGASSLKVDTTPSHKLGSQNSPSPSKTKVVLEAEPRKMQAERPVLLQDLSQSKLLLKFKQENKTGEVTGAETTTTTNTQKDENTKSIDEIKPSVEFKNESPKDISRKDSVISKKVQINNAKPAMSNGGNGVYGEDFYDGGGVYGADLANMQAPPVIKTKQPSATSTPSQRRTSKDSKSDDSASGRNQSTAKNRKSSKEACDDLEKAYLISATQDDFYKSLNESDSNNKPEAKMAESANHTTKTESSPPPPPPPHHAATVTEQSHNGNHLSSHNNLNQIQSNSTTTISVSTPRKPTFNPLHVILKDKNKYHTTEYI